VGNFNLGIYGESGFGRHDGDLEDWGAEGVSTTVARPDLRVRRNFTVLGSASISTPYYTANDDAAGDEEGGFRVYRGAAGSYAAILWDPVGDAWVMGTTNDGALSGMTPFADIRATSAWFRSDWLTPHGLGTVIDGNGGLRVPQWATGVYALWAFDATNDLWRACTSTNGDLDGTLVDVPVRASACRASAGSATVPSFLGEGTSTGVGIWDGSRFSVICDGAEQFQVISGYVNLVAAQFLSWSPNSAGASSADLILGRKAAATLRMGGIESPAPVAQTLTVQGALAGADNIPGADFTLDLSQSTGSGAGGRFLVRGTAAGGAGSAQNAYATILTVTPGGDITVAGNVVAAQTYSFHWSGRSRMYSSADGVIELTNAAVTGFTRLCFGGTSSSFPALKRNGAILEFRLADDSAYTEMRGLRANVTDDYQINGVKVIGAQGAALPADATDDASSYALANAMKARMIAHGLVAAA
jgi:hypothetical protein